MYSRYLMKITPNKRYVETFTSLFQTTIYRFSIFIFHSYHTIIHNEFSMHLYVSKPKCTQPISFNIFYRQLSSACLQITQVRKRNEDAWQNFFWIKYSKCNNICRQYNWKVWSLIYHLLLMQEGSHIVLLVVVYRH